MQGLDCILGMGDSKTALGWMRRSNFREEKDEAGDWKAKQQVARKLAQLSLSSNTMQYCQWFPGKQNMVADSIS